jgi:uncharacterized protein Yka (UPF0111/DUF47 family)
MAFPALLPKDDNFSQLLTELAEEALISARQLKEFMDCPDRASKDKASAAVTAARTRAKLLAQKTTEALCRCFITPFDREDIQDLTDIMYKIPKTIEKVRERVILHDISCGEGDFARQVDLILQEAEVTRDMVRALVSGGSGKSREVTQRVNTLRDLEQQGDSMRNELMAELFRSDRDIRDLLLRRDIYDMLEKVVDRFRDAAGVVLQIVLKYS